MEEIQNKLINPVALGGAPFSADIFLNIQENARQEALAFFDGLIKEHGFSAFGVTFGTGYTEKRDTGGTLIRKRKNGIFVSSPDLGGTVGAMVVSPCFVYLDGKLLYFAGGTFDLTAPKVLLIERDKNNPTITNRVFEDGGNNPFLVTEKAKATVITYDPSDSTNVDLPPGADQEDEVCLIYFNRITPTVPEVLGINNLTSRVGDLESLTSKRLGAQPLGVGADASLSTVRTVKYSRDAIGRVSLYGEILSSSGNGGGEITLFTLPVGFRPKEIMYIVAGSNQGSPTLFVDIAANQVIKILPTGEVIGNKIDTYDINFSFDNISFDTI